MLFYMETWHVVLYKRDRQIIMMVYILLSGIMISKKYKGGYIYKRWGET
jgi:hypothetical protein